MRLRREEKTTADAWCDVLLIDRGMPRDVVGSDRIYLCPTRLTLRESGEPRQKPSGGTACCFSFFRVAFRADSQTENAAVYGWILLDAARTTSTFVSATR